MTTDERGIYQGISLPASLLEEIKKYELEHPEYKSTTDFIREAIRDKLNQDARMKKLEKDMKHVISILGAILRAHDVVVEKGESK